MRSLAPDAGVGHHWLVVGLDAHALSVSGACSDRTRAVSLGPIYDTFSKSYNYREWPNISSYLRSELRAPAGPEIQIRQHLEAVAPAHFEIVADIWYPAICPFGTRLRRFDRHDDPRFGT